MPVSCWWNSKGCRHTTNWCPNTSAGAWANETFCKVTYNDMLVCDQHLMNQQKIKNSKRKLSPGRYHATNFNNCWRGIWYSSCISSQSLALGIIKNVYPSKSYNVMIGVWEIFLHFGQSYCIINWKWSACCVHRGYKLFAAYLVSFITCLN